MYTDCKILAIKKEKKKIPFILTEPIYIETDNMNKRNNSYKE